MYNVFPCFYGPNKVIIITTRYPHRFLCGELSLDGGVYYNICPHFNLMVSRCMCCVSVVVINKVHFELNHQLLKIINVVDASCVL